jgi:MoxR-like ATPase
MTDDTATIEEEVSDTMTGKTAAPKTDPVETARQKVLSVKGEMNGKLIERSVEVDLVLLSLIARRPGVFVGSGGIAKSMTVDEMVAHLDPSVTSYKVLLRKSMPVEEIFGPLSIKGLENDQFRYITTGRAAEVRVLFLDEIFKANAVVLNAMLMLINEGVFINDGVAIKVPLWATYGASNEMPTDPELAAFRDRFAWAREVKPVSTDDSFKQVLRGAIDRTRNPAANAPQTILTEADVIALQQAAAQVTVPEDVLNDIATMRRRAEGEFGLFISARRYISGLELCRAQAVLNGRQTIISDDLTLFQHTLWTDPEDAPKAFEVTLDYAGKVARVTQQLRAAFEPYHNDLSQLKGEIPSDGSSITQDLAGKVAQIQMQLRQVSQQVTKQIEEARSDKRDVSELEALLAEVDADRSYIKDEILG